MSYKRVRGIWNSFIRSPAPILHIPEEGSPDRTERSSNDGKYLDVLSSS